MVATTYLVNYPVPTVKPQRPAMSQDQAIQITAHAPQILMQKIELALDQHTPLEGLTYSLIEEDEAAKIWRLDMFPKDDEDVVNAKAFLKTFPDLIVTTDILADADWLALALSGLPPVRAGRFFIYGAHDLGRVPQNAKALRIEAGAAFGTGHHATTTGCLLAYHKLLKASSYNRVLDIGTGTGILALAAASMRTKTVVGTDIDPIAVRVAKENAKLNQLQARFVKAFGLKSKSVTHKAPYDLVFANILAPPLIALAPDIFSVLKPEGLVILSGLLRHQERAVAASYRARGFIYLSRVRQNPWVTLVFKRKA